MAARERIYKIIEHYFLIYSFNVVQMENVDFRSMFQNATYLRHNILDIICCFDIETTTLDCGEAIMYIWQFYIDGKIIVGRQWEEFKELIEEINKYLKRAVLKIFVHNLSYEFQFLAGILDFEDNSVDIIKSRKIMRARYKNLIFVCSYLLSNMSLSRFCQSVGAKHKAGGLLDYKKQRYPHTLLNNKEIYYCLEDVEALADAVKKQNLLYGDDLSSMPYTSTGYVRRECKENLRRAGDYCYHECKPDEKLFQLLRLAFRGGNTHANRLYVGKILENVGCYDISSAYPAAMLQPFFPTGGTKILRCRGRMKMKEKLADLLLKNCVLFRVKLFNLDLIRYEEPIPYIAAHKAVGIMKGVYDNGRVLKCEECEIVVTEFDWDIICRQYNFDWEIIGNIYYWDKGYLPESYIETVLNYYDSKTLLKTGDKYLYGKSKNKLNALYGMLVQNPIGVSISWLNNDYYVDTKTPIYKRLWQYEKRAVMDYQKGVWVTAICRWFLQQAIDRAGMNIVYCDTDSIKFIGELDLSDLKLPKDYYAIDTAGKKYPIGVFEYEEENFAKRFRTWGAKKYAFEDKNGELHITVAGVQKKEGAKELARKGGLEAFKPGFIWKAAGGKELIYNDKPRINYVSGRDGFVYPITRNVAMFDSTYTLTVTPDYALKIADIQKISVDMIGK